eukprot:15445943-Alexandrium_andersonii.AAC.1
MPAPPTQSGTAATAVPQSAALAAMMSPEVLGVITEAVRAELESRAAASAAARASYWSSTGGAAASASVDPMQYAAGDPWGQPPAAQPPPSGLPPRPPEPPAPPTASWSSAPWWSSSPWWSSPDWGSGGWRGDGGGKKADYSDPPAFPGWPNFRLWRVAIERWDRNTDVPLKRRAEKVLRGFDYNLQAKFEHIPEATL